MDSENEGPADRGGPANPEPGVEPGPVRQDTSVYVADVGPPAAAPRPPRTGNVTMYLGAALLVLLGFSGGIFFQKRAAAPTVPQGETGAGGDQGAGHAAGAGGDTQGVAGADSVFGQVTRVKGSTISVTDEQGNVVKITTSTTSRFSKTSSASIGDLRPGDNVVVQGSRASDGSFAATVVNIGGSADGSFVQGGPSNEASPGSGPGDNG